MITLMNELMEVIPQELRGDFTVQYPVNILMSLERVGDIIDLFSSFQSGILAGKETATSEDEGKHYAEVNEKLAICHAQYPFLISYQAISTLSISSGIKVKGNLNLSVLWESWRQLIKRHPILRVVFTWDEQATSFKEFTNCLNNKT